jgi:dolichol-phosphate mannosyltransferase
MKQFKLTIIIPAYNEIDTIQTLVDKISEIKIDKQIIIVDDCSSDGTNDVIFKNKDKIDKIIVHKENKGKGGAIKSAQKYIEGKYTIIQDADLEYDPKDYLQMINFTEKNELKVLYGSRVLEHNNREKVQNFSHKYRILANYILTKINNFVNNQELTDAHTCYKLFDSNLFKSIKLCENGFAFCPEVTTKISNLKINIAEIPISYKGRTYDEGKKITYIDGIEAIFALIKYKFLK